MSGGTAACPPRRGTRCPAPRRCRTASLHLQRSIGPAPSPVPGARNLDSSKHRSAWVLHEAPLEEQALGCDAPGLGAPHRLDGAARSPVSVSATAAGETCCEDGAAHGQNAVGMLGPLPRPPIPCLHPMQGGLRREFCVQGLCRRAGLPPASGPQTGLPEPAVSWQSRHQQSPVFPGDRRAVPRRRDPHPTLGISLPAGSGASCPSMLGCGRSVWAAVGGPQLTAGSLLPEGKGDVHPSVRPHRPREEVWRASGST